MRSSTGMKYIDWWLNIGFCVHLWVKHLHWFSTDCSYRFVVTLDGYCCWQYILYLKVLKQILQKLDELDIIVVLKSWVKVVLAIGWCYCFDQSVWWDLRSVSMISGTFSFLPPSSCSLYKAVGLLMNKAVQPFHQKVSASMASFVMTENWWWILLEQLEPVNILYTSWASSTRDKCHLSFVFLFTFVE